LPKSPEYELLEKLTVPQLKKFCEDQNFRISFTTKKDTLPRIVQAVKYRGINISELFELVLKYKKVEVEEEEERIREIREITRRKKKISITEAKVKARKKVKKIAPTPVARKIVNSFKRHLRAAMLRIPKDEREIEQAARAILLARRIKVTDQIGSIEWFGKKFTPDMVVEVDHSKIAIELKRVSSKRDIERAIAQATAYATKYNEIILVLYDVRGIVEIPKDQIKELEIKRIYVLVIKH